MGATAMIRAEVGRMALLAWFVALWIIAVLASLSGCLTAAKIGQWQRAVYGWGMDRSASKPCQVASADASKYLANGRSEIIERTDCQQLWV